MNLNELEKTLSKIAKTVGTKIPVSIRIGHDISISEASKHIRLLRKLKYKDVSILVMEKDKSQTIIPIDTSNIKRIEKTEIPPPPEI